MSTALKRSGLVAAIFIGSAVGATAAPLTFDGITFPDGALSFADSVVSYEPGTGVSSVYGDPAEALGMPDYTSDDEADYVSLGFGGTLILRFSDNSLTTSGDSTADLHIFEIGGAVEQMLISISTNNANWIDLGLLEGQPTSIDIDGVTGVIAGAQYSYVRIIDGQEGASGSPFAGADIDAVGAISSAPPVPDTPAVPLPAAGWMLVGALGGLGALRRLRRA